MEEKIKNYNRNADVIKALLVWAVITLHFPFKNLSADSPIYSFLLDHTVPGFMFMSGYVRTLSLDKKGYSSLEDAYSFNELIKSLLRLVIPFTVYFVFAQIFLRIIGYFTIGIVEYGLLATVYDYLRGFRGEGAYYFPIMIQFVFLFPVIWRIIKKKGFAGVWIVFAINLFYEIIRQAFGMTGYEYSLLIFRYMFIISCGCYAALYKPGKTGLNALLMVMTVIVGMAFIYLFVYSGYGPSARIITDWQRSSLLTCLYAAPFFFIVSVKGKMRFKPLEIVGKASFNIFLVQMLYFIYFHFTVKDKVGEMIHYPLSILICTILGIAFYYPERYLTAYVVKKITRS